jgi:hypothetical protein
MKQRILLACAVVTAGGAVVPAPVLAWTAAGDFGSAAFLSRRDCGAIAATTNCMPGPPLTPPRLETFNPGGPGKTVNATMFPGGGGKLVGQVQYGQLDLPTIKAGAWAGAGTRVGSTVTSYMHYRYTGWFDAVYALDAVVDWKTSGASLQLQNGFGEYAGEASGVALLWMFDAALFPRFTSAGQITDFTVNKTCGSAGVLAYGELPMTRALAGYHEGKIGLNTACGGGALMVTPGQEFVIMAVFQSVANRGGYMDATNTFRVQLAEDLPEDAKNLLQETLVSARSVVPEPASWAMMIAGFGLVGAMARRRRPAAA